MKIFISWSGKQSGHVALALRDWLPTVIQKLEPWMSAKDIDAGKRWGPEIAGELEATRFGILCLTRSNPTDPWLVFEAGALAKTVSDAQVVPYCIGMEPKDIPNGPLSQFQGKKADHDSTLEILKSINKVMGAGGLPVDRLRQAFEQWWPDLEKRIGSCPEEDSIQVEGPGQGDKIDEILMKVRHLARAENLEKDQETPPDNTLSDESVRYLVCEMWQHCGDVEIVEKMTDMFDVRPEQVVKAMREEKEAQKAQPPPTG